MYWRAGIGRALLCIAALTCCMGAAVAWSSAGSANAAYALLCVGVVLTPPVQEMAARLFHVRAPAKLAFYSIITLLPMAVGFITIDGFAMLDAQARKRGFASASEMERARSLKIVSPEELARHDEAEKKVQRDLICREKAARPPLVCFEPAHRTLAVAFANQRLDASEYEVAVRDALGEQRKRMLATDRGCTAFLDRLDEEALPVVLGQRGDGIDILAALWAGGLTERELKLMGERAKPGVSYLATPESGEVERKIDRLGPQIERRFAAEIQVWSQRIVLQPNGWRGMLGVRPSVGGCKPAEVSLGR